MAVFNEILAGRFNRYLQKLTGIKAGPPVPALASEIIPTIDVQRVRTEDLIMFGIDEFMQSFSTGPVAAANSGVQIRNPSQSGVVATVVLIYWTVTVQDFTFPFTRLQKGTPLTDLPTQNTAIPLDTRSGRKSSSCILSVGTAVNPFANDLLDVPINANGNFLLGFAQNQEIVLNPGAALLIVTTAVNTLLDVTYRWRERALEDSEKAS